MGVQQVIERQGETPWSSGSTALVVVLDQARRNVMAESLALMGISLVHEADDFVKAFRLVEALPAGDVAVVDLGLARRACSLLSALHARGWNRTVVMTTRAGLSRIPRAMGAGATGWLMMPSPQDHSDESEQEVAGTALLTAREVQVIQMVAEGMTNATIGRGLRLSGLTVKSHLRRIARKLDSGDRAEIVAIAMRAGLVV